ncbi:MAG: hypothetical protein ACUVQC_03315 [Thermaceae bacterium]
MGFTRGFAGLFYAPIEPFGVLPVLLALGVLILPAWGLALWVKEPYRMGA